MEADGGSCKHCVMSASGTRGSSISAKGMTRRGSEKSSRIVKRIHVHPNAAGTHTVMIPISPAPTSPYDSTIKRQEGEVQRPGVSCPSRLKPSLPRAPAPNRAMPPPRGGGGGPRVVMTDRPRCLTTTNTGTPVNVRMRVCICVPGLGHNQGLFYSMHACIFD